MRDLKLVALGVMLGWVDMDAGEEDGNNWGPFVTGDEDPRDGEAVAAIIAAGGAG